MLDITVIPCVDGLVFKKVMQKRDCINVVGKNIKSKRNVISVSLTYIFCLAIENF